MVLITSDLPLETKILLFFWYWQNIFLGYWIVQFPISTFPLILDKNFLIQKIENLKEKTLGKTFINFEIVEKESEINVFFDNESFNLVGWQTKDIYQNVNITYLSSIKKNYQVNEDLFELPTQN